MNNQNLHTWLCAVVMGLVSRPLEVMVIEKTDEEGVLYTIKVHEEDQGKVIGKGGSIATSLRTILRSAGKLSNVRASMLVDIPGSKFRPNKD